MIENSKTPPSLEDPFLDAALARFKRRRKAINYHGRLRFSYDLGDAFQWVTVVYSSHNYPSLILQLVEGGRASLFIRSNRRADRGKVLLALEDLRLPNNAERLVATFEWTIGETHAEPDPGKWHSVRSRWNEIAIRALPRVV